MLPIHNHKSAGKPEQRPVYLIRILRKTTINLLIITILQRIARQPTKHQPRDRRPDAPLPVTLSGLLRNDRSGYRT